MRFVIACLVLGACGGAADLVPGVYTVSLVTTGNAVGLQTVTVTGVSGGVYLDTAPDPLLQHVLVSGASGDYQTEIYAGKEGSCDAGRACFYTYERITVTVPGDGLLHLDICSKSAADCAGQSPTCNAARNFIDPRTCETSADLDARRTGPLP